MIEKKTATIAVLCVATVLLLGLWSNSAQEARTLNSKYVKVVEDYNRLTSDYSKLESEKSKLKTLLDGAKAIAESAEWVSEDGRLKVTSELIPKFYFSGELSGYTIRVNVTNIGDKPLDTVKILLFPYKNDKFVGAFYYGSYESCTITDLYIGETYSHDLTGLSKDMTSYKVLAVVG